MLVTQTALYGAVPQLSMYDNFGRARCLIFPEKGALDNLDMLNLICLINPITPRFFLNTLIFGHRNQKKKKKSGTS